MRIKAELRASLRLGLQIMKSIFKPSCVYYRCPYCNLVIESYQKKCDRCDCKIGWENNVN